MTPTAVYNGSAHARSGRIQQPARPGQDAAGFDQQTGGMCSRKAAQPSPRVMGVRSNPKERLWRSASNWHAS
ncbi:MAG TPA: hypothetical protein VF184_08200 [Phycisphaeraceae bacterium]